MKNNTYILGFIVCLIMVLGLILGFGRNSLTKATITSVAAQQTPRPLYYGTSAPLPDETKYFILFQELKELDATDNQNQLAGESTYFESSFYKDRLGLDSSQATKVDGIVTDCLTQIQPLDQRASEIITQYRAQYPYGKLKPRQASQSTAEDKTTAKTEIEPLPPPPSELIQLEAQKNQIVIAAKEKIRLALGDSAFTNFDAAVQHNSARILEPLNSRPTKPRRIPTRN